MARRWCLYLAVLLGSIVFYWAYQQWLAWLLLVTVLVLPLLSLVVSLPAIMRMRMEIRCAGVLEVGMKETVALFAQCGMPAPPYRGMIRVTRTLTGEIWTKKPGEYLPAEHCGQLLCSLYKTYAYDYLGLFRLRVHRKKDMSVIVRPKPLAMKVPSGLEQYVAQMWKPKPGGGFSENHELRLYRPGDNLNQVHWKLTAKTGKLVVREAMEPEGKNLLLTMVIRGNRETLDRMFGRLQWLGGFLLRQGLRFDLHALTGDGVQKWSIANEAQLQTAIDKLLCQQPAEKDAIQQQAALWSYHIGGEKDEGE